MKIYNLLPSPPRATPALPAPTPNALTTPTTAATAAAAPPPVSQAPPVTYRYRARSDPLENPTDYAISPAEKHFAPTRPIIRLSRAAAISCGPAFSVQLS